MEALNLTKIHLLNIITRELRRVIDQDQEEVDNSAVMDPMVIYSLDLPEAGRLMPMLLWLGGTLKHFWFDVLPFIACCKLTSQCETYYEFRPSDDCSDYQPPRPTIGTGDPHFISLDGKEFTFNGAGEFVLVKSSLHNFTFQTRMEVLAGTDASVYTSFVLSSDISDTIQVQRSPLNGTLILLNGEPIDLYFDGYLIRKQDFRGLRLTVNPDVSEITVRLHIGATALIRITSEMMSFILQLPDALKGQTEGLLGNFNDNADDDFILRNGSSLLHNSTLEEIHFDFGLGWILDTNTSKFTYLPPYDFSTFFHPDFIPNLVYPDVNSVSEEVKLICGESITCLYDAVTTNSTTFANDSLQDIKTYETVNENLVKIVSCGQPGKIENGAINGSVFLVGYTVVASCNEGFYLDGNSELLCYSNGTWSGNLPICIEIPIANNTPPTVIIVITSVIGSLVLIAIIVVIIKKFCLYSSKISSGHGPTNENIPSENKAFEHDEYQ
ncbi:hypothetical protein BSL78_03389 [Apostichopus japonicus]|uniref:Sushi domain-containing protein 2-like n=1 Tax=Stichopus japonicus TaxID=307972 RepID=A0A2G8LHC5_STIJA|nr:hypothetical protein BSL78_03389 [Apostichopus japonicus]